MIIRRWMISMISATSSVWVGVIIGGVLYLLDFLLIGIVSM
jgi:hypothetical protein